MRVVLIDGNALFFRCYHASKYSDLSYNDIPIAAIHSFGNLLNQIFKNEEISHILIAFDKGKKTFRHQKDESYKATRKPLDEALIIQLKKVREMLDAYNIKYYEMDDYEADDIIGSLAKQFAKNHEVVIYSSDKDLLQLVNKNISYNRIVDRSNIYYDLNNFKSLNDDLSPSQIIELKAVQGDNSDNIKGIKGIGLKTVLKILHSYEDFEAFYQDIDNYNEITPRIKKILLEGYDSYKECKELVTIYQDINFDFELDDLKFDLNLTNANNFLDSLELRTVKKGLNNIFKKEEKPILTSLSIEKGNTIPTKFYREGDLLYFIHNHREYYNAEFKAVVISDKENSFLINFDDFLKDDKYLDFLNKHHFYCYDKKFLMHNIKKLNFDKADDLMLMLFVLNNNFKTINDFLNAEGIKELEPLDELKKKKVKDENSLFDECLLMTNALYNKIDDIKKALTNNKSIRIYQEIELPLIDILFEMENEGISVDNQKLSDISSQINQKLKTLEDNIYDLISEKINLNSPKQLAELIYDKLKLSNSNKRSTDIDTLNNLIDKHPFIPLQIEYRKYTKLNSTYASGLIEYIGNDSKIHTIYNQLIDTGRLSSKSPNLQNIVNKDDYSTAIRKAFYAKEGYYLISSDYSQIELRVLAHISDDQNLIKAFINDEDIHTATAAKVFNIDPKDVSKEERRKAKIINFGIVYGMSAFRFATENNLDFFKAKEFMDNYFNSYPAIKNYLDDIDKFVAKNNYVKNIFGRYRYFTDIMDKNAKYRAAINMPIQGSAADIMKLCMLKINKKIKDSKLDMKLLLQIHDELIFEVKKEDLNEALDLVKETMENAYKLKVPLKVDIHYANNLGDLK